MVKDSAEALLSLQGECEHLADEVLLKRLLQKYEPVMHSGENYPSMISCLSFTDSLATGAVCLRAKTYPRSVAATLEVSYGQLQDDIYPGFISSQTEPPGQGPAFGMDVEDELYPLEAASEKDNRHGGEVNKLGRNFDDLRTKVDDTERR